MALETLDPESLADALVGLTAHGLLETAVASEVEHVGSGANSLQPLGTMQAGREDAPRCFERLAFHDGKLWAESFRRIWRWDATANRLVSFHDTEAPLDSSTLVVSADGRHFATAHRKRNVALWDAHSFERRQLFEGHSEQVAAIRFTSERVISCSGDGSLRRWNMETGEELDRIETTPLYSLGLHPSKNQIAAGGSSGSKGHIVIVDTEPLAIAKRVELELSTVPFPPLSDRGRVSAGITAERRDKALVSWLTWLPDGRHLVAGSWDRTLKLYNVDEDRLVREWVGHSHWVTAALATPSGRHVLSCGGVDGKLIVWSLDAGDPLHVLDLGEPIDDICLVGGRLYAAVMGEIRIFSLPRELRI